MLDNTTFLEDIDTTNLLNCTELDNPELCKEYLNAAHDKLTILSQNIRSINKNFDSLLVFLQRLKFKPDLIILTECWLDESFNPINLEGYNCNYSKKYINKNDGIVVFSKSELCVVVTEPPFSNANCLQVDVDQIYSVIVVYRSPSFYNLTKFLTSLENVLSNCTSQHCALVGDINLDIKETSTDPRVDEYLNLIAHYGYVPGHTYPTRGTNSLDHCMIKSKLSTTTIVCHSDITDHSTVLCIMGSYLSKDRKTKISTKIDYKNLLEDLKNIDWTDLYDTTDINEAIKFFIEKFNLALNQNKCTRKVSSADVIVKKWITPGLLKCIRRRDELHSKAKKNPNDTNLQEKYRVYRNHCINILHNQKAQYEQNLIIKNQKNIKKTWDTIKTICNINKTDNKNEDLLTIEHNSLESLNVVNQYFSSIGDQLASKMLGRLGQTEIELANKSTHSRNFSPDSLFLTPTDEIEIIKLISTLKSSTAVGHDNISNDMLKQTKHVIASPVTHICNLSISSGVVPEDLKIANVIPIFKAGETSLPANYRPISLLSALSKVIEKVVNVRLIKYLEHNSLLAENQFGFRAGRSTEDAVTQLVDTVVGKMDKGQKCMGVFLDLAKAFDTVSRPILLKKLEGLGIRGLALDWFRSYLGHRKQRVRIGEHVSDFAYVDYGVPQGSVLGPTLFLIYINDLCSLELCNASIFTFADDTAIIFHEKTWSDVVSVAQEGLKKVATWLQDNLLTLNVGKTKSVCFSISARSAPDKELQVKLHTCGSVTGERCLCSPIEQVPCIKYLGILIDGHLTWKCQIDALVKRTRKLSHIFKKLRSIAKPELIRIVYLSLCQSVLSYCVSVWGAANKTLLLRLERAQRAILKIAYKKTWRYSTDALYSECSVLRIRQLFIVSILLRFHRHARELVIQSSRTLKWYRPRVHSCFARRSFAFLGPYLYSKFYSYNKTILTLSYSSLKHVIFKWLHPKNYNETEHLLCIQS